MDKSLQNFGDNPKDDPKWQIYPAPPPPSYIPQKGEIQQQLTTPATTKSDGEAFDINDCVIPEAGDSFIFKLDADGVFKVYSTESSKEPRYETPSVKEYFKDLDYILGIISDGPTKSFAFRRLRYLESKFNMYILLNEYQEMADSKRVPHRDFYNVRKVDTHVHHSACMNQKHLLRFIKAKMKRSPQDVVIFRDEKYLTLAQVFESLKLTAYDLSIDTLDMHVSRR